MKKYIINSISLAIFFLAGSISCTDVLDKNPLTEPSSETYWQSGAEASRALLGCYYKLKEGIYSGGAGQSGCTLWWESLSDNAITTSNWEGFDVILKGDYNPGTSAGVITKSWRFAFAGIAQCNYFLENIDRVDELSETERNEMKGEAYFLRAFYYNDLVQLYGDVPLTLQTENLNSGYLGKPRTPKADVVKQIIADLDLAIQYLPNIAYTDGHAVKGSAIGLKTRVLLNNEEYALAAETASSLIHSADNPFSLHDNYLGIFFGEQTNNPEIMFSVQFNAPEDYHSLDQVIGSRMSLFPTLQLINAYESNDPRRKMTIFEEGDPWVYNPENGFSANGSTAESRLPFLTMAFKKFVDTTVNNASGSTTSDQHFVKLRYADMLLMYAEAMFESGQGSNPLALQALNQVRTRPGVEMPAKTELTREIIRNERRIELAGEGYRYNDILRWKIADQVIPEIEYDELGNKRVFKAYLLPIPLSEMDIMGNVWKQNPGY